MALVLAAAVLVLPGCAAMENTRNAVARTGNQLGQKVEQVDQKVSGPLERSRAKQVIDNTGAKIDRAVDGALKRN
ncbi:hypothetical protein JI739_22945 [Ramlibacter sp. AW1]|uniref:CsbD family protein n=1 Tax=Ramlibacter aurantiacus TaxID=2801330 RepID=A0A936ZNW6_9BURK|nr:hypothetical protein [Ramlibacter aurantiacus]MBL0423212.1 hypothetical protein [Ramlibacter aurantiacus]